MKRYALLILTIFVLAPLTPLAAPMYSELDEEVVPHFVIPNAQVPYASPEALNPSLNMPDTTRVAVSGNDSWIQMAIGDARDPTGFDTSDIRFSMIRRNATNVSHFTDTTDQRENNWPEENGMHISSTNPKNETITVAYTLCNRQNSYSITRGTASANYNDPFCSDDGIDSDGALIEFYRFSMNSNQSTKLGTLSYDNCGYVSQGYTVNPPNYIRRIASGIVDQFKIQEFDSTGFQLAIVHKHILTPSGGGNCDIMFNGTSIGQLPANDDSTIDVIQVGQNGSASLSRIQSNSPRDEIAINGNIIMYQYNSGNGGDSLRCYDLQNDTVINTHTGWRVYGTNTAPESILVPINNGSHHGLLNTQNCSIVYTQPESIFGNEVPIVWTEEDNLTRIISFRPEGTSYSLPFNLSIPMGSNSGTYLALVYPNGTLHSALRSTISVPPGDRNSGIGVFPVANGETYILDTDFDSYSNIFDIFPNDGSEWIDTDDDGYGDNQDDCDTDLGTSTVDRLGCPDSDFDGTSNLNDAFIIDPTQQNDADFDGYGDNASGFRADACISTAGISYRDRYGCLDTDADGQSDENDFLIYEPTQWNDTDSDGYGDNLYGYQGDKCPTTNGNSSIDSFGCLDLDGDGYSNLGDAFDNNPTQWLDTDGDGYGDNTTLGALQIDTFPSDGTQWEDSDGDGHGDNPYGTEGDWFPNNPDRWEDSDRDGAADEDDSFVNDATQWNDSDGDGYGDNPLGNNPDAFPNDSNEWLDGDSDGMGNNEDVFPFDPSQQIDSDGDGYGDNANGSNPDAFPNDAEEWSDTDGDSIGNNADAFPFDPSQQIDSDGDGFGDNERGSGADKFPSDSTQWSDIDGDGYGDNAEGTNPDAFIADPTQWADADGDGYGDNPTGRLADAFSEDVTQWIDQDGDGLGDNQSGTNPDPYLFDFDNDGYNDSIDPLPKLPSPGDLDNDGVLDVNDLFPEDFREWADYDGDGEGDNADTDDDNDGWADTDEIRLGTDPFGAADVPIDSFEIVIPGTAVGLGAWDLIGMFGGIPLFMWIGFGFVTRNGRTAKYEGLLREAQSRDELEDVARMWEYSLMLRMLGPHQGIRLERLRAELDDRFEAQNQTLSSIEPEQHDQTQMVEQAMQVEQKSLPSIESTQPEITAQGNPDGKGYEWYTDDQETSWYRNEGSNSEWQRFEA
jgi:hypothetical protein